MMETKTRKTFMTEMENLETYHLPFVHQSRTLKHLLFGDSTWKLCTIKKLSLLL